MFDLIWFDFIVFNLFIYLFIYLFVYLFIYLLLKFILKLAYIFLKNYYCYCLYNFRMNSSHENFILSGDVCVWFEHVSLSPGCCCYYYHCYCCCCCCWCYKLIGYSWSFFGGVLVLGVLGPMIGLDSGVIKVRLGALFFSAFCLGIDVLISGSGVQAPLLDRLQLVFFEGLFGFGGAGSHDWTSLWCDQGVFWCAFLLSFLFGCWCLGFWFQGTA